MGRKNVVVRVRLTEKEYRMLEERAKAKSPLKSGRGNLSGYIRSMILEPEKKSKRDARDLKELTYQIRKIGVNVNQIAAKANSGYFNRDLLLSLKKNQERLEAEVRDFFGRQEEAHGNHKTDEP